MKILLACPIGIGNYLLAYPAFSLLKKHAPDAALHLLGLRNNIRDWATGDPLWSGIHVFDPTKVKGDPVKTLSIITGLRRERFDACLNFFPSNKWQYNLLPVLAGIPRRYGFRYRLKRLPSLSFLGNRRLDVDITLHDWRQNVALTEFFAGTSLGSGDPAFPPLFGEAEEAWARQYAGEHSSKSTFIGIHPGSSADHGMDAKRWPPERFAHLADLAAQSLDATVFILGGPEEADLKRAVAHAMRQPGIVTETPSLKHTAALVRLCRLAICNDSGIMHMAACMGVPTVGIFGPTDERRNGPVGPRTLAIRHEMPGFPLWTAANVGVRSAPRGVDPMASLKALSAEEAWGKIARWVEREETIANIEYRTPNIQYRSQETGEGPNWDRTS